MKLYLLPFRDRIYLELRRPAADADPGRKFAWRLKDWAVYSALPEAARSLGMVVPIRQIRYPLIDSLSEVAQSLVNNALVRSGSNSVEQSGRYRMLGSRSRFTYTTWAFPAGRVREHRARVQAVLQGVLRAHGLPLRHADGRLPPESRPQRAAVAVVR